MRGKGSASGREALRLRHIVFLKIKLKKKIIKTGDMENCGVSKTYMASSYEVKKSI